MGAIHLDVLFREFTVLNQQGRHVVINLTEEEGNKQALMELWIHPGEDNIMYLTCAGMHIVSAAGRSFFHLRIINTNTFYDQPLDLWIIL